MDDTFRVTVGSGTLMSTEAAAVTLPHRWTTGGVTVQTEFTGAHLLHLSIAGCVLNDVHREAVALGIDVAGVRVSASGGFDRRIGPRRASATQCRSTPPRRQMTSYACSSG